MSFHSPEYVRVLEQEVDRLRGSNELLIAELGRIAEALEVDTSMKSVLDKIAELKAK